MLDIRAWGGEKEGKDCGSVLGLARCWFQSLIRIGKVGILGREGAEHRAGAGKDGRGRCNNWVRE